MALIVNPKTKKQEKMVKAFLESHSIGFHSEEEEDIGLLKAMEKGRKSGLLTSTQTIDFIKKQKSAK